MFCKRGSNDRNKNSLYNLVNKERWVQLRTPLSFPGNIPNITSKALLFRFGMCVHMLSAVSRISSAPWLHLSEAGVSCAGWNRTMLCCLFFFYWMHVSCVHGVHSDKDFWGSVCPKIIVQIASSLFLHWDKISRQKGRSLWRASGGKQPKTEAVVNEFGQGSPWPCNRRSWSLVFAHIFSSCTALLFGPGCSKICFFMPCPLPYSF